MSHQPPDRAASYQQALEAIAREIAHHDPMRLERYRTLKDLLHDIAAEAREAGRHRRRAEMVDELAVSSSRWVLAVLAIILVLMASLARPGGDSLATWVWNHRHAILGCGALGTMAVVGISLERTSFVRTLWGHGSVKLLVGVTISAILVCASAQASAALNAVFQVDASALPYARAILTGVMAYKMTCWLFAIVAFFGLTHAVVLGTALRSKVKGSDEPISFEETVWSGAALVCAACALAVAWAASSRYFPDDAMPYKAYRLGRALDFDSSHTCTNVQPGAAVLFIGPDQAHVLVDENAIDTPDLETFVIAGPATDADPPKTFSRVRCQTESQPPQSAAPELSPPAS